MAYRYTDIGYYGACCLEEVPDFCMVCGSVCENDTSLCDRHLEEKNKEDQIEINFMLDELGEFITNL